MRIQCKSCDKQIIWPCEDQKYCDNCKVIMSTIGIAAMCLSALAVISFI